MIAYLKSFIFIAILRGNLGKFQVVTQTVLLQIQVVHNCFWSSLTIGWPGISNTGIAIPPSRTNQYKHSFFVRTDVDWNHLDENIVSAEKLESFKSVLAVQRGSYDITLQIVQWTSPKSVIWLHLSQWLITLFLLYCTNFINKSQKYYYTFQTLCQHYLTSATAYRVVLVQSVACPSHLLVPSEAIPTGFLDQSLPLFLISCS